MTPTEMNMTAARRAVRDDYCAKGAVRRPNGGLIRSLLCGTVLAGAMALQVPAVQAADADAAGSPPLEQAQSAAPRAYDIPGGPLAAALNRFADESGLQMIYDAALASGLQTQGIQGRYTAEQALRLLLTGTGVSWHFAGEKSVTLNKDSSGSLMRLDTVAVVGTKQSRYNSRHAETGTRFDKDLIDIPRTIDIIPEQLLLDQHARELEDVYKLSPNTVNSDGFGGTREDYIVRGFRRDDDIYRNGVRLKTSGRIDPATVDSIQILKGPVADIGQMTPGGLVNVITKKPEFERQHHVETNIDEDGERNVTFDATGPIGDSENFAYRITGSGDHGETFRQNSKVERQFLSTSFLWVGDNGATARVNHEVTNDDRGFDRGIPTVAGNGSSRIIADVPVETAYHPDFTDRQALHNIYEFEGALPLGNTNWTLENKLFYYTEQEQDVYVEVRSIADDGTLTRRVQGNDDRNLSTLFGRLQARGKFDDLKVPVEIVGGFEYHQQDNEWKNYAGSNQTGGTVSNPTPEILVDDSGNPSSLQFTEANQKSFGPYVVADIDILPSVNLSGGLRYELYSGDFYRKNLISSAITTAEQSQKGKLTKTAGAVWHPVKDLSVYANYAETFTGQSITSGDDSVLVLEPEQGRQYEAGVKWNALGGKLLLSAAVFDIKKENVVETVNGNPQLVGEVKTRGFEFSGVGNPLPGWNIRGGLGLLEGEIVSTNISSDGNRPRGVPKVTASVWSSYEFTDTGGMLDGLGIGAGATFVGPRFGDDNHTFKLGQYLLFDVGMWYYVPVNKTTRIRFDLGVKNITNETYYTASGGTYRINPGSPRSVFAGMRVEF